MSAELVGKYPNDPEVLRDYILELESRLASAREIMKEISEYDTGTGDYIEDLCRNWLSQTKDVK